MTNVAITNVLLGGYIGGQMEIKSYQKGCLLRGEIKTIALEKQHVRVEFVWLARNQGTPTSPKGWVDDDGWAYELNSEDRSVSCGRGGNLHFGPSATGEVVTLFPSDGERLDPNMVAGLQFAEA